MMCLQVCERMMPGLERLAREMEDVAFLYVDVSIVIFILFFHRSTKIFWKKQDS
jgi:hypothetical protein